MPTDTILGSGDLDVLPEELLIMIFHEVVNANRRQKNAVLDLRFVCRRFNNCIAKKLLTTIQLDFDRLASAPIGRPASVDALGPVANCVRALSVDLAIIRSPDEIKDLQSAFSTILGRVPSTQADLDRLRIYCMNENSFDEAKFKDVLLQIFEQTPSLTKLKLTLPFKIVGQPSRQSTTLFANALESIKSRDGDMAAIKTLVINHLSDATLLEVYHNPQDLQNALTVFKPLRHLVIGFRRETYDPAQQAAFTAGFWRIIGQANDLKSLCISGWNSGRHTRSRASQASRIDVQKWNAQRLPYRVMSGHQRLSNLTALELSRVDIQAPDLVQMLWDCSNKLKELYFDRVYLKHDQRSMPRVPYLWIGHGVEVIKAPGDYWIADEIKRMRDEGSLKHLEILRATSLGYDYINQGQGQAPGHPRPDTFDIADPAGTERHFEERFVQRAMGLPAPALGGAVVPVMDYDLKTWQLHHDSTSVYQRTMDGHFNLANREPVSEMLKIVGVANKGMKTITKQLETVTRAGDGQAPDDDDEESDGDGDDDVDA